MTPPHVKVLQVQVTALQAADALANKYEIDEVPNQ